MAGSQAFEWLCEALTESSSLERLEARSVSPSELAVVVQRILPRELRQRGVSDEAGLCERLVAGLRTLDSQGARGGADTPDAIFRRLGGEA